MDALFARAARLVKVDYVEPPTRDRQDDRDRAAVRSRLRLRRPGRRHRRRDPRRARRRRAGDRDRRPRRPDRPALPHDLAGRSVPDARRAPDRLGAEPQPTGFRQVQSSLTAARRLQRRTDAPVAARTCSPVIDGGWRDRALAEPHDDCRTRAHPAKKRACCAAFSRRRRPRSACPRAGPRPRIGQLRLELARQSSPRRAPPRTAASRPPRSTRAARAPA